jgi:hypothetical protein
MSITRSTGIPAIAGGAFYGMAGGGYEGATEGLDATVQEAARALEAAYGMDVVIRFNSDRESGGAWLRTHEHDGIDANAEVGIGASVVTKRILARWEAWSTRYAEDDEANYWRDLLRDRPEGVVTVTAHITAAAAGPRAGALRELDDWNDYEGGYHHGEAESVADALARCLRFAPPAAIQGLAS